MFAKKILFLGLLITSLPSMSAVYKCNIDGVSTYSELPCSDDAIELNISVTQPQKSPRIISVSKAVYEQNLPRELEAEIDKLKTRIKFLKKDISKYKGGLILANLQSAMALESQTLIKVASLTPTRDKMVGKYPEKNDIQSVSRLRTQVEINDINKEVGDIDIKIENNNNELKKYSGGLIRSTMLSTDSTMRYTVAILKQKQILLMLGQIP